MLGIAGLSSLSSAQLIFWIDSQTTVTGTNDGPVTAVSDQSVSHHNVTGTSPNRPVWSTSVFSNSTKYAFYIETSGASNDQLNLANKVNCAGGFSAFATFKTNTNATSATSAKDAPMTLVGDTTASCFNAFGLNGSNVCYVANSTSITGAGGTAHDGNIHTIAVSHSASGAIRVYFDGVLAGTGNVPYNQTTAGFNVIGTGNNTADGFFDSDIAEVLVWNGTITSAAVARYHARAKTLWYDTGFDPTSLVLSGYWRANYPGSPPWDAILTTGISATIGPLTDNNGNDPSAGTTVNSFTPAHYNGTSSNLINNSFTDVVTSGVWTKAAGTIIALANFASAAAPTGNIFDDPAVLESTNETTGMTYTTSGIGGYTLDNADAVYNLVTATCSTGAWHLCMFRWNATTIGITVDSGSEVTNSRVDDTSTMSGTIITGAGNGVANFVAMDCLEMATAAYTFSNGDYSNFKSYVNTRYGLSL